MGIQDNILARLGYISKKQFDLQLTEAVKREIDENLPHWLGATADAMRYSMPDPSIFANQADLYRLSSDLGSAVEILGNDVGTAKFNVKRYRGENVIDIDNHPFELLLRNPNPVDSGLEFARDTVSNYKLNGNAVWWLNRADQFSIPDEIWTIPFSMIKPIPDKFMYISHYEYYPGDGSVIPLHTWEIVHFKTYNPNNRFIGLSPLESLIETIQGALGMRRTSRTTYMDYNGSPPSILAFKDYPANDIWANIKEEMRQAAVRNQMMMLRGVGDGVTWLSRAMTSKDADFIASLKQSTTDIFNRMCPGLVAMLSENATEANALAARATYSEKTLWVMMEAIAQKVTSDILPAYGIKLVGMFDDPRVVDRKLELEEQSTYERTHTIGEVRKEYYQDDPLGDERDDLFLSQISATSGQPEPRQILPPMNLSQPQLPNTQQDQPQLPANVIDEVTQADEAQAQKARLALDALAKYERYAVKKIGKRLEFTNDILPDRMITDIAGEVLQCTDESAVKAVFRKYKDRFAPLIIVPDRDAFAVVKAIELALTQL